jgi:hypothetical protein
MNSVQWVYSGLPRPFAPAYCSKILEPGHTIIPESRLSVLVLTHSVADARFGIGTTIATLGKAYSFEKFEYCGEGGEATVR